MHGKLSGLTKADGTDHEKIVLRSPRIRVGLGPGLGYAILCGS